MSSRRQDILAAIEIRLKTIRINTAFTVNGQTYLCGSDIGEVVFLRRIEPLDESESRALNILDGDAPASAVAGGYTEYQMQVALDCLYREDDGTLAEQSARDVLSAIGSDPYWGGLAESTVLDSANLDVQIFDDRAAGFSIPVKVTYQVPNWTL